MSKDEGRTPWHGLVFGGQGHELSEEDFSKLSVYEQACAMFAATSRPANDTPEGWLKWAGLDWSTSKASAKEKA